MSTPFYDLASLVVVPSGYKASKVYAQKPLTTDGQLTFSRASTATRVNSAGLIETVSSNVPRLDYQGSTCPKLLLEPQRTNYARKNNVLGDWTTTSAGDIISTAAGISPDGTNNAIKLVPNTANTGHLFYDNTTSQATGGNFVMSCYAKAGGLTKFGLRESQSVGYYATFNLSNGTVVEAEASVTASIQSMGNGWYRCIARVVGSVNACIGLVPLPSGYTTGNPLGYAYAGNGTDGVLVYQPQLEVSATYATSPISTAGVASATRLADTMSKTLVNSNSNFSLFLELDEAPLANTSGDWLALAPSNALGRAFMYSNVFGFADAYGAAATVADQRKFAWTQISSTTAKIFSNGVLRSTGTSGSYSNPFNLFSINANHLDKPVRIKQIIFFDAPITDAQAIELTTL